MLVELWWVMLVIIAVWLVVPKWITDYLGWRVPTWSAWVGVLASYSVVWVFVQGEPVFLRMVCLCSVLLVAMKGFVYVTWRKGGGAAMTWPKWLAFSSLWFGMEPKAWCVKRRRLGWKKDAVTGGACCLCGCTMLYLCYDMQVNSVVLLFIAMSVGFHFGVLRLLTAFWRACGVPVRVLFRNPLPSRGFADFWSARWNLSYSQMMARTVQRPIQECAGKRWAVLIVFIISGLFHELAITVPAEAGFGLPTLFFVTHGLFTALENGGSLIGRAALLVGLVCGVEVLFPPEFQQEVFWVSRDVFGKWVESVL